MDENDKELSQEDYLDAVSDSAREKGTDLLTDPEAVAAAKEADGKNNALYYGQKLRATREHKGFTLEELATKTGIHRDALARAEEGKSFLPLGLMVKLSKALSMRMADIISKGDKSFAVVRANERRKFDGFGEAKQASRGYQYESLAADKGDRAMEPFIVTLNPASSDEHSSHEGQEFIYVLEGTVAVTLSDNTHVLEKGDSIIYNSNSTHLVQAQGTAPAKILAVLSG